jgi:hypothetical protein
MHCGIRPQKAAAIKRLREILPQKLRQRQSLKRHLSAPAQAADAGHLVLPTKPKVLSGEGPAAAAEE